MIIMFIAIRIIKNPLSPLSFPFQAFLHTISDTNYSVIEEQEGIVSSRNHVDK